MIVLAGAPVSVASTLSGGALAAYVALTVSIVTPLVAVLNAWLNRKTRRERDAAVRQIEATGGVITTGSPLEWRTTDHAALLDERAYAQKTRSQLTLAEDEVRTLRNEVAECGRRMDVMQEDLRQLRVSIAACTGGPVCPIRPALRSADLPTDSAPS